MLETLPTLSIRDSLLAVVASAIVVHLIYKKYEPEPTSFFPTFALLIAIPGVSSTLVSSHFSSGFVAYLSTFALFYASLLSSIITYRVSPWHPLARYPGPILAKISMFWLVRVIQTGKQHVALKSLHDQYGPYVRIGPNELSLNDVDLISKMIGPDGMPKGPLMDGRRTPDAPPNVIAARNFADHALKRKPWMHAFSSAALRDYGPNITRRALQLAEELDKFAFKEKVRNAESVNLTTWLSYFAFDFMGDMAFGGGFELMREGDVNGIWGMMTEQIRVLAWQQRLAWSTRMLYKIPVAVEAVTKFRQFTMKCALQRKESASTVKDLFYYLNNEDDDEESKPPLSLIIENGEVAIIAGSDTTSTVMSGIFYHLLANPDIYRRLQDEIDVAFPLGEGDPLDTTRLSELTFLNAVINETLRLQPSVLTLQRAPAVGSGGKRLGNHFIPEGTAISVSPYVVHRDARYFSPLPETFLPDRWLQASNISSASSEMKVKTTIAAFLPFSAVPANCVGKNLALAEIRAVVALLLHRFEIRFADGYDPRRWEDELEDMFVLKVGELPVVLTCRM
ncbi:high nitrogen upregulated cytochrome P450 monooxygenase 2 [Phellopilus nigrolimitatus]|nr:high nitrogen upregulated cytochrome P450 monooxygenase 2 [Phellopilus nigrolimitatus]